MSEFLHNLNEQKVLNLMNETEENVSYFNRVVEQIVENYTGDLNILMNNIKSDIVNIENPATETIEKYFLELSNLMYFVNEKVEKLSIYDSMSKSAYKEVYNKAYLDNQIKDVEKKNKTTVAENQAVAENASIYESAVNDMYNKAYKIIKIKLDSAQTMISTLSKVLSRRIQEIQNSGAGYTRSGLKILNEYGG